jgi:hypothetical protein
MEGEMIIGLMAVIGLIVIPSLAVAVRLSFKPMVEAIVRLHDALGKTGATTPAIEGNEEIRARLANLEAAVEELRESSAFYRELKHPRETAALTGDSHATNALP